MVQDVNKVSDANKVIVPMEQLIKDYLSQHNLGDPFPGLVIEAHLVRELFVNPSARDKGQECIFVLASTLGQPLLEQDREIIRTVLQKENPYIWRENCYPVSVKFSDNLF